MHQGSLGVVSESDAEYTVIEFDEHGRKKFLTRLVTLQPSDEPPPKRRRARKKTTTAPRRGILIKSNPWFSLPAEPPFLLPDDRRVVEEFNRKATSEKYHIETRMLPEPFVGSVNAPMFCLLLNPGAGGGEEDLFLHKRPDFRRRVHACHRQEASPYPNYFLDPNMEGPGARWNRKALKPLLKEFGARVVASGVTFLEYFPYHSQSFRHDRIHVPSQEFTFQVLREALRRRALVIIMCGKRFWEEAVPELNGYRWAFITRAPQTAVISPGNCPTGYEAAQAVLRELAAD